MTSTSGNKPGEKGRVRRLKGRARHFSDRSRLQASAPKPHCAPHSSTNIQTANARLGLFPTPRRKFKPNNERVAPRPVQPSGTAGGHSLHGARFAFHKNLRKRSLELAKQPARLAVQEPYCMPVSHKRQVSLKHRTAKWHKQHG